MAESAKRCLPLTANFLGVKKNTNIGKSQSLQSSQTISGLGLGTQDLKATQEQALADLEKFMSLKKNYLYDQILTRHRRMQSFLKLQLHKPERNRIKYARQVAECFEKGGYLAQKIVTWERQWVTSRCIENGNQRCHAKSHFWFNDKGVQLCIQKHFSSSGEKLTAWGVAKAVGEYLKSNQARDAVAEVLGNEIAFQLNGLAEIPANLRIRPRTAQN